MSSLINVLFFKCFYNVLALSCLSFEISVYEMSVYEMSVYEMSCLCMSLICLVCEMFRLRNFFSMACLTVQYLSKKRLVYGKCCI